MLNIVLFEPEIPPNTGNIIRLCANTGCALHIIEPTGFSLDNKQLRRAGLDYHEFASMTLYSDWDHFMQLHASARPYALTTKGGVTHSDVIFQPQDYFVFGPETRGLPNTLLDDVPKSRQLRIPMIWGSRSLNLSNAVSIVVYEAWRQLNYTGTQ